MPILTNDADIYEYDPTSDYEEIDALDGDDTITVRRSNFPTAEVTIFANDGDDTVYVTNETFVTVNLYGGNGDDRLSVTPAAGSYILEITPTQIILGNDAYYPADDPVIYYSEIERLVIEGYSDSDTFWTTGDTMDTITVLGTLGDGPIGISSGGGNDEIFLDAVVANGSIVLAGDGDDIVHGSSHDDDLDGGDGDDILIAGGGWDILTGGSGSDIFRFDTMQGAVSGKFLGWIDDFEREFDIIDLSGIDADMTTPGDQAFHLIGTAQFSGTPGELRGTSFAIQADRDGDTFADMIIHMPYPYGGLGLTTVHFVL